MLPVQNTVWEQKASVRRRYMDLLTRLHKKTCWSQMTQCRSFEGNRNESPVCTVTFAFGPVLAMMEESPSNRFHNFMFHRSISNTSQVCVTVLSATSHMFVCQRSISNTSQVCVSPFYQEQVTSLCVSILSATRHRCVCQRSISNISQVYVSEFYQQHVTTLCQRSISNISQVYVSAFYQQHVTSLCVTVLSGTSYKFVC